MQTFSHLLITKIFVLMLTMPLYVKAQVADNRMMPDTLTWFDAERGRQIPVAFYKPVSTATDKSLPLVVFSHGYGQNKGGDYLGYSRLLEHLASSGYFVVSIQHELPTDPLLPMQGEMKVVRRPFWERGADNILFVIHRLKKTNIMLDFEDITLAGHSNGGDMTALFAEKYPGIAHRIITMDNRRMRLPLQRRVFSLRSSDQPADEGVLPSASDQAKFGITMISLPATIHNDMDDSANAAQQEEINRYILGFLRK